MSNEDIKAMSDEDLMANWTSDGAEAEALKDRLKAYSAEYQERCLLKQATDALGPETVAKLQAMEPVGVPSEEAVAGVEQETVTDEAVNIDG